MLCGETRIGPKGLLAVGFVFSVKPTNTRMERKLKAKKREMENREIKDITQDLREIKYATGSIVKRLEDILKTLKEPSAEGGATVFVALILVVLVVIVGVATWHFW